MLNFGRFIISLLVIIAVFCFAWCIDQPAEVGNAQAMAENGEAVAAAGKAKSPEQTPVADQKLEKREQQKPFDFSSIAITDPFAGESSVFTKHDPPKTLSVEQEGKGLNSKLSKLENMVIEPPPLVGDFSISTSPNQKLEERQPDVPELIVGAPDVETPSKSNDWADDWGKDPNAPPPPVTQQSDETVQANTKPTERTFLKANNIPDRISDPFKSSEASLPSGQKFVGDLVVVQKKPLDEKKPIGFVKHVWKQGDSLPDLAALYLGNRDRFMEIIGINGEGLKNPTRIPQGTVLKIPVY